MPYVVMGPVEFQKQKDSAGYGKENPAQAVLDWMEVHTWKLEHVVGTNMDEATFIFYSPED